MTVSAMTVISFEDSRRIAAQCSHKDQQINRLLVHIEQTIQHPVRRKSIPQQQIRYAIESAHLFADIGEPQDIIPGL